MSAATIATAIVAGFGLLIVVWVLLIPQGRGLGDRSALGMAIDPVGFKDLREQELEVSFGERVLRPLLNDVGRLLARLMPKTRIDQLDKRLAAVEGMWNLTPLSMVGLQILLGVTVGVL